MMRSKLNSAAIALAGVAAMAGSAVGSAVAQVSRLSRKDATPKPVNARAGSKFNKATVKGNVGIRHRGLGPINGIYPQRREKQVKGPHFTRSVKGKCKSFIGAGGNGHMSMARVPRIA